MTEYPDLPGFELKEIGKTKYYVPKENIVTKYAQIRKIVEQMVKQTKAPQQQAQLQQTTEQQ